MVSNIIRIFVLLVVVTETGSRQDGLAEGGLQPAVYFPPYYKAGWSGSTRPRTWESTRFSSFRVVV